MDPIKWINLRAVIIDHACVCVFTMMDFVKSMFLLLQHPHWGLSKTEDR